MLFLLFHDPHTDIKELYWYNGLVPCLSCHVTHKAPIASPFQIQNHHRGFLVELNDLYGNLQIWTTVHL